MKLIGMLFIACLVCALPALSHADCASDTKACEDAKGAAHRCAQTYGYRAEVMCENWNKLVETSCAKAGTSCSSGGGIETPATRRNQ